MENCAKCNKSIIIKSKSNEADYVICDTCNSKFHPSCTSLSASEIRVFALKVAKRQMNFSCSSCRDGDPLTIIKNTLASLSTKIEELQKQNADLVEKVDGLKESNDRSRASQPGLDCESMYAEIVERQWRSKNILIYDVPENDKLPTQQRFEEDKKAVVSILDTISDLNVSDFTVSRFKAGNKVAAGRANTKQPVARPIRVQFRNPDVAMKFIRNKKMYKGSARILPDRTKRQREHLTSLINQLKDLEAEGITNKHLKYINGVPRIMDKLPSKPTSKTDPSGN